MGPLLPLLIVTVAFSAALFLLFKLMQEKLERLQAVLVATHKDTEGKLLKENSERFEKVQAQLKQTELQLQSLSEVGASIEELNDLMKLPHLRGNFGEATLERLLSDLLPAALFELQYRVQPHSLERVDAVIKYPDRVLPIDSKFPREQVLPLFESRDPEELDAARSDLAHVMRGLAKDIRDKYIHPEHGTTDMALLFVPSETLYFECLRNLKLVEELGRYRVFAVSPNTLAITLHSISLSHAYYEMARGVEATVRDIRKARAHLENFSQRFEEVGTLIARAEHAFHTASTHLSRYGSAVHRLTGEEGKPEASDSLAEAESSSLPSFSLSEPR